MSFRLTHVAVVLATGAVVPAAHGQSVQFAKSGLIEALGWLRKQTSQPVTAFEPVLLPSA